MTSFTAIDLSKLPPPDIIEPLNFESILAQMVEDFRQRYPEFDVLLESDPGIKLLETAAYRELLLRARINDSARAVMLPLSIGADLDNLAALFGVQRQIVSEGDPDAIPPTEPEMEADDRLRQRTQLSLESFTTAGSVGSYIFHALSASPMVKDVSVQSPVPGHVYIAILSTENNGEPSDDLLSTVEQAVNADDVRPLTDFVTVNKPSPINIEIRATLTIFQGPDSQVVYDNSVSQLNNYIAQQDRLGGDITRSGIFAALHQPGVSRVILNSPTQDIIIRPDQIVAIEKVQIGRRIKNISISTPTQ